MENINTSSADYLAGFAAGQTAGRGSLLVSVELAATEHQQQPLELVRQVPAVVLASGGAVPFGPFQLSIFDLTPEVETFPDLD